MAGLGSSLLGDLGRSTAAATKPKKKPQPRKRVPPALRQTAPAKAKKTEVHLGSSLLEGIGSAAHEAAHAHEAPKKKPARSIKGLSGKAGPGELVGLANALSKKTSFSPETRVPLKRSGGGGLPLASIPSVAGKVLELGAQAPLGVGTKLLAGGPGILGRAGRDALDFPKTAVLGTYGLGHAAEQLVVHGRTKELEALGKGLTEGALGQLLQGNLKGALKAANEHPLYAALDVAGGAGAIGRVAGAAARGAGALGVEGNALARAGALTRADLKIGDTGQVVQGRRYSPDLLKKGAQVLGEKRKLRKGEDPYLAAATPSRVRRATGLGRSQEERLLKRGADETSSQVEAVRRVDRDEVHNIAAELEDRGLTRRSKKEDGLVAHVIEGGIRKVDKRTLEDGTVIRPFRDDVKAELKRLQGVDPKSLSGEARRNNKLQREALDHVLKMDGPAFEKARVRIVAKAEEAAAHLDRIELEKISAKALDKDQALAARVRTYAVKRMGLRYDPDKRAPEELAARHKDAGKAEVKAKATLDALDSEIGKVKEQKAAAVAIARRERGEASTPQAVYKVGDEEFPTRKAAVEKHGKDAEIKRIALTADEAKRVGTLGQHARNLKALKAQRAEANAAHKLARRNRVASNPKKYVTGLVDADGRRVSAREILEHIKADPDAHMPSFLPHITSESGGRAHFINFFGGRRQVDGKGVRTGSAAVKGAQDASIRAVGNAIVRGQGEVSAVRAWDRFIGDLGKKDKASGKTRLQNADDAEAEARAAFDDDGKLKPGHVEYEVVRAIPAKIKGARREDVEGLQNAQRFVKDQLGEGPQKFKGKGRNDQAFALVPKVQMERLRAHQNRGSSEIGKVVQAYTGAFRGTVLPFSVKWLAGNSIEAALRLAIQDNPAGLVQSRRAGVKVLQALKDHDEDSWREFRARTTGGLQYGGQHQTYHGAERFEGTSAEDLAKRAQAIRQIPGVKAVPDAIGGLQRKVFAFNTWVERNSQITALGKEARREMQATTGSWVKATRLQKAAVDDVAKGLVNTPNQVRFARAVDDTLGKYNRFGPSMRATIVTAAPFLPWYLNSVKFIAHTLPAKHPVKTAVLASAEQTLRGEFERTHEDAPPGSLQDALRTKGGGFLDLSRFTPFGVVAEGGQALSSPFAPQFVSMGLTLAGLNFTAHPLRLKSGEKVQAGSAKAVALALYAALESTVPGVSIARRLQERGESAFDDSLVVSPKSRGGTSYGQHLPGIRGNLSAAINRIVNPVRPTHLSGTAAGGGGSSSEGGWGGAGSSGGGAWGDEPRGSSGAASGWG